MNSRASTWLVLAVPLVFLAWFFAYPLVTILVTGLFGDALPGTRSAGTVADVLRSPRTRSVVWFTTWQAAVSTLATLVAAWPVTLLLSTRRFRGRRLLRAVVTVPFVLPTTVVGAAFTVALGPRGPLPFDLTDSVTAIVVAHVFFNVAVVVRVVGAAWEAQSPRLLEAARTLGADAAQARRRVTVALLRPAVLSAAAVVFLFTFTSLGVVLVLGDRSHATIEVEVLRRSRELLDLRGAATLAVVQLLAVGAVLWVTARAQRRAAVAVDATGSERARQPLAGARDRWLLAGVLTEVGVLVVGPVALLVLRSFRLGDTWSLAAWRDLGDTGRSTALASPGVAVATSLRTALAAMVVALVVGGLASLALTRARARGVGLLDLALTLPLGTSAATLGFGFLLALDEPIDLRGSPLLVPAAQALVAVPFVVRVLTPALQQVDDRLRGAARTLGATPRQVVTRVDLPLVARAGVAAAAFAFAISVGEFGATVFVARSGSPTMPVLVERLLARPGEAAVAQAAAMSTVLVVVVVAAVLLMDRFERGGSTGVVT